MHRLRHAKAYHSAAAPPPIPRYQRHAGRCTAQHSRSIIIRYIRGCRGVPLSWIHARRCNIPQTIPARRGQLLPSANRWQVLTHCQQYRRGAPAEGSARRLAIWHRVSGQGAPLHPAGQSSGRNRAGGAEPLTATAVSLFRAFAR